MSESATARCLNCAAELTGPFCSSCGQRHLPPDPSLGEFARDAWQELSGYDGRIAATLRALVHPGRLTREFLEGHRARYLSPVRLYLIAGLMYFVTAAAAPDPRMATRFDGFSAPGIDISARGADLSTPEGREQFRAQAERAPWPVKPLLLAVAADPTAVRSRALEVMPRVFFAMLPVFAAIVALFYRGRHFPTHLAFATHVHAFAFAAQTFSQVAKFTRSPIVMGLVGVTVTGAVAVYVLRAFREVYGDGWRKTLAKAAGIGMLYAIASIPAFVIILAWAAIV